MVVVPAGEFMMGGSNYDDEKPVHKVSLNAFYIDKYEVTNSYYKACVDSGKCAPPKDATHYEDPNYSNHPVVYVTWDMAQTYCQWRNQDGQTRLPTEAEWEKAARGTDGRTYPWGGTIDHSFANYDTTDTVPVDSYEKGKGPYGTYNMIGNVREWVFDWYMTDYYVVVGENATNPLGPVNAPYDTSNANYGHVDRGGGWNNKDAESLNASYRNFDDPAHFSPRLGFRCARPENPLGANIVPTSDNRNLPLTISNNGAQMALVLAGEFTMGSDNGESDEKPVHKLYLNTFYMDVYEVTNSLYKACVDTNKCSKPHYSNSSTHSRYYGNPSYDNYPVIDVDWNMAKTYCEWREARLPTEAEWEKAARGTDTRTYPWGNSVLDTTFANYNNSIGDTTPVGNYQRGKSPYDLYDMVGNVWEWVSDWYLDDYYQGSPYLNPLGPSKVINHVTRGGSWATQEGFLYITNRGINSPEQNFNDTGFRCAKSMNP